MQTLRNDDEGGRVVTIFFALDQPLFGAEGQKKNAVGVRKKIRHKVSEVRYNFLKKDIIWPISHFKDFTRETVLGKPVMFKLCHLQSHLKH